MWEIKLKYQDLRENLKKENISFQAKEFNSQNSETIKEIEDSKKKKKKLKEEVFTKIR